MSANDRRPSRLAALAPQGRRNALPLLTPHLSDELFPEPAVALPEMPLSEHVVEDYVTTGLSLKDHPVRFFRDRLTALGARPNAQLRDDDLRQNMTVTVAGLVLVRQRPGTAKGVIFMTLEDETDIANIIVWPKAFANNRRVVMTSRFLAVRGRLQRAGLVIHVVAEKFFDLVRRASRSATRRRRSVFTQTHRPASAGFGAPAQEPRFSLAAPIQPAVMARPAAIQSTAARPLSDLHIGIGAREQHHAKPKNIGRLGAGRSGKHDQAIERFYTEDATMQENVVISARPRPLVARERAFMARFSEIRTTCVIRSFVRRFCGVQWVFEFVRADRSVMRMETGHQRWQGRIAEERFYYDPGQLK